MQVYMIKLQGLLRYGRLIALSAAVFVCNFLLSAGSGAVSDPNSSVSVPSEQSAADSSAPATDSLGPTVLLSYSKETFRDNPISSFMYFVPLISPTPVDRQTSANNEQRVGIISYKRQITSKSFNLVCEFEMLGQGFHKNTFDPTGMVALFVGELKKGETLTNMLDYIQFEGDGFGRIEVKGTHAGSAHTVTEINMQFNAKGRKSPVTIGLYDVEPVDGQYRYENRSNQAVARVNSLLFKKSGKDPRMGIKVASISKSPDTEGLWAGVKGAIANLLIRPPKVDRLGNDTMLDFGNALLTQKTEFTFPEAKNIRQTQMATIDYKKD